MQVCKVIYREKVALKIAIKLNASPNDVRIIGQYLIYTGTKIRK